MMLFFLPCLLAVFPVVSMKSPIFGPREMNPMVGSSASITCYYPATSVNRHTRKYWCRQGPTGVCTTLISSQSYISTDYKGRAKLTDFPERNIFVVDISNITKDDSGNYKCGLGINTRGLSFDVNLQVTPEPVLPDETEINKAVLDRTVTVICPFNWKNGREKKSVFKIIGQERILIIDSTGYRNPEYGDRVNLTYPGGTNARNFTFIMKQFQLTDTGNYVCEVGKSPIDTTNFYLQKYEPELIYGDLRGSVAIDCALDPKLEHEDKFLCRRGKGGDCDVVINTKGKKAQDFEGRILLTPKDKGSFSVTIAGLRKEDAGAFLCGAGRDGEPEEEKPTQPWQLFVNEETAMPLSPSVVKGVEGGSVAVRCPYNPKERNSVKYWCHWEDSQTGSCPLLVQSEGLPQEQTEAYDGKLALYEEPGDGTYTVILNQLSTKDAGYYWCLTNGDTRWTSMVELKIVEGEPTLKVPTKVTAFEGETTTISCHVPCKFYSYEKYWCKWSPKGCSALPVQGVDSRQPSVNCDQESQLIDLVLSSVTDKDKGWYWCGVKNGPRYEDAVAVYVEVKKRVKAPQDISPVNALPEEKALDANVRKVDAEDGALEEVENPAEGSRASADTGSSTGQVRSSTVLVSTLVPLALVLALGAVALGVARARHRRNVDRISIQSYKTDITMSDFENSRDFGGNDNMGASPVTQETPIEGNNELTVTTEDTTETKKTKRSSKEEADMAYTNFVLLSNNMAANVQERPSEV